MIVDLTRTKERKGRFEIVGELGQGGQGRVLEVFDHARGEVVALKEMRGPDRARLSHEFRLLHRLRHPHLVRVHDFFQNSPLSADASAYTLERVHGLDLVSAVRRLGPDTLPRLTDALLQALAQLHAAEIAHLDLKPDNVLVGADTSPHHTSLRLIDFGIAHPLGEPLARVSGSPSYLAPELLAGHPVTATADLFGLGVLLAECLLSQGGVPAAPRAARALAELPSVQRREALVGIATPSEELGAVIELAVCCLEPQAHGRPQSVALAARAYGAARRRSLPLLGPGEALAMARSGGLVGRGPFLRSVTQKSLTACHTTFVRGEGRGAFVEEAVHEAQLAGLAAERWPVSEPTTAGFVGAIARLVGHPLNEVQADPDPERFPGALMAVLRSLPPGRGLLGMTTVERAPLPVRRFVERLANEPGSLPLSLLIRDDAALSAPGVSNGPSSSRAGVEPNRIAKATPQVEVLELPAATEQDIRAFLVSRFGQSSDQEALRRWLQATSAGSFGELEALSELLVAKGRLAMGDHGWEVLPISDSLLVRGRIPERLQLFSPQARDVIDALRTLAGPLPRATCVECLGPALHLDETTLGAALDELDAAGWLEAGGLAPVVAAALGPREDPRILAAIAGREGLTPALAARVLGGTAGAESLLPVIDTRLGAYQVTDAKSLCELALSLIGSATQAPDTTTGGTRLTLLRTYARIVDLLGPREAQHDALEALLQALPEDEDESLEVRSRLFWTKTRMGDSSFVAAGHELLERARARNKPLLAAEVGVHLAITATQRGEQDEAERLLIAAQSEAESVAEPQRPDVLALAARIANNLGNVALYRGDHEAAQRFYRVALDKKRQQGDPVGERIALGNLALTELELGRPGACLEALIASRAIAIATGHRRGEAWSLLTMAEVGLECGAYDYAERRATLAANIAEELGDTLVASDALTTLAEVLLVRGELPDSAGTGGRAGEWNPGRFSRPGSVRTLAHSASKLAEAGKNRWTGLRSRLIAAMADHGLASAEEVFEDPDADPGTRRMAARYLVEASFARGELTVPFRWQQALSMASPGQPTRVGLRAASAWHTGQRVLELSDPRAADRHRRACRQLLSLWLEELPDTPLDDGVDREGLLDGPSRASARRSAPLISLMGTEAPLDARSPGWDEQSARASADPNDTGTTMASGYTAPELVAGDEDTLRRALGSALTQLIRDHGAERGFVLVDGEPPELLEARDVDGEALTGGTRRLPEVALEAAQRLVEGTPWRGADGRGALLMVPAMLPLGPHRAKVTVILQNRFVADAFADPMSVATGAQLALALTRLVLLLQLVRRLEAERDDASSRIRAVERESTEEIRSLRRELESTREQLGPSHSYTGIVFTSSAMKRMLRQVDRVVTTELSIHIHGESGTGKELVARAIHDLGPRKDGPFVPQNCTAIPPTLFESELFGHERGSFTGAVRTTEGLFRRAHLGTLFLDEIGDLPLELQAKLLRVLETGEVRPVGATRSVKVDVRVVSATHRDLKDLIARGSFREDLYYRLNVIRIEIPALRERPEDIPVLARHFLALRDPTRSFDEAAMKALVRFPWPGNVRQLENEVSRAALLADGAAITVTDLSPDIGERRSAHPVVTDHGFDLSELMHGALKDRIDHLETVVLRQALENHAHNKSEVARVLGLSRAGLNLKLKRLGLWDGE